MSLKINLNPSLLWLLSFLILCIVLLYPPFVFFQFVNESARIILFACILITLFLYQMTCYFDRKKVFKILFLWVCLFIYFIASAVTNGMEGAKTSVGYAIILVFAVILFSIMQSENRNQFFKLMFNIYTSFFFIVPIFCICNFLLNLVSPSFNFLTPYFSEFKYNYQVSPFGLIIPKSILGINLSRNFFFFIEPVYLALFYLINVLVIGKNVPKYSRIFILLNVIGGLLTASYFFFIGYVMVRFLKMSVSYKIVSILIAFFLGFVFIDTFSNFFSDSSYGERLLRIEIALEILKNFSNIKLFLGAGYLFDHGVAKGVSSGFFTSFIEGGLVGFLIPLVMSLIMCQGNKVLVAIVFLSLLLFEPYKLPFFWYVIVVVGSLPREITIKKILQNNLN